MTRLSIPLQQAVKVVALVLCYSLAASAVAQTPSAKPPDLSGSWGPYGGGRGADPNSRRFGQSDRGEAGVRQSL
jgi:hypothetical protein